MKLLSAFLVASGASWAVATACNPDNCARAVTGTQLGPIFQSSAKADCSSFLAATVYPSTVTSTITTTIFSSTAVQTSTSTVIEQTNTLPQTVQPTLVPAYASPCSGVVRYSSACSCFGIVPTTITLATPTSYTTTTITSSVVATSTPVGNAVCQNGQYVDGLSAPCTDPACQNYILRIEGVTDTIYEGLIRSGPRSITTPSGGTHLCDGTNNGANPVAKGTSTTALDSANTLCGFGYDGTYDTQFSDYFITSIGGDTETSTQFWGLLNNFQFTPVGGCQMEPAPLDEILWAYNAFQMNYFLDVQPRTASVALGASVTFTVKDGTTGSPISGALFDGVASDANGQVSFTASQAGVFRFKATKSGAIRSPAVVITVTG